MPSDVGKLTFKGLIEKLLTPNLNVKYAISRQQSRFTSLVSLILGIACLIAAVGVLIAGLSAGLVISLFFLTITMTVAFIISRTENYQTGSIILVCGIILAGFSISASVHDLLTAAMVLLVAVVSALSISVLLLPLLAIVIISVVTVPLTGIINVNGVLLFSLIVIESVFILTAWRRDIADTQQQDEIGGLRGRLEEHIEERTRYARIAADIAQEILSASSMDELLTQAANLITSRLKFSYTGIFISDETERHATLKAAQGSGPGQTVRIGKRVNFDSSTLLGWVAQNKQQRVVSRIIEDALHLDTELLPENQSEIALPVLSKGQVLGILDVQSTRSSVFDSETIVVLEMISSQIATALQNIRQIEIEQGNAQIVADLNLARTKIIQAKTHEEILQILDGLISELPYVTMYLTPEGEDIRIALRSNYRLPDGQSNPETFSVSITDRKIFLSKDPFIGEGNRLNSLPYELVRLLKRLEVFSVALVPILSNGNTSAMLLLGTRKKSPLSSKDIELYTNLAKEMGTSFDRIHEEEMKERRIVEMEANTLLSSEIAKARTEKEVLEAVQNMFQCSSKGSILLVVESDSLRIASSQDLFQEGKSVELPEKLDVTPEEVLNQLGNEVLVEETSRLSALYYAQFHPEWQHFIKEDEEKLPNLHPELIKLVNSANFSSVAVIPLIHKDVLDSLIIVGTASNQPLSPLVKDYSVLTELIISAFNRFRSEHDFKRRIDEDNARISEESKIRSIQFQVTSEIAEAKTDEEVFKAVQRLFRGTSNAAIFLISEKNKLRVASSIDLVQEKELDGLPKWLNVSPGDIFSQLGNKVLVEEVSKLSAIHYAQFHPELQKFIEEEANRLPTLSIELIKLFEKVQFSSVALMPIIRDTKLIYLIIVGSRTDQPLSSHVNSYNGLSGLIASRLGIICDEQDIEYRLNEDEEIILMSQEITSVRDLPALYGKLHAHIRQTLGNVDFLVSLFDENTNTVSVPYVFEAGADNKDVIKTIEPVPVGEGLNSILIRTRQPLMLVEDVQKQALALDAKITGKAPKSWLGTPMIVADKIIGTIVVQDTERELAFEDNDLRFLTTLSTQIASTIYNARLLEETKNRAVQLQTAAEIARDISSSLNVGELIIKAVTLIRERFNYYHAAIFLIDSANEFAVIREATGEAGIQMKRAEHKLKVGSKSIVGYTTGSGEPLIVNDTNRDATYYANPLLPETRAEVAIPLKVGQRILGALDVQSTQPYSFKDEDVSVLRILSDQMAIAVINSELFADVQEHLSQHRLLHHVTTAAASGTTLEESLTSATQGLQVTLGGDRVSILLADQGKKTLKVRAYAGYSEEVGKLEIPFGEGITGWVAVHQQPQRINDITQDPRYIQVGSNIRSELAIPLSYRGDLLGVLNVESDQTNAYNENDEEMLGTLGGSLAAIISNARLIERVRRQVDHERMLYEVTSKIRRSTDMHTIMATTAGELSKVLGARRAQIKMGALEAGPEFGKSIEETVSTSGDSE